MTTPKKPAKIAACPKRPSYRTVDNAYLSWASCRSHHFPRDAWTAGVAWMCTRLENRVAKKRGGKR